MQGYRGNRNQRMGGRLNGLAGGGGRASMVRHGNSDRRSLRRCDHRGHCGRRHRHSGSDHMVLPPIRTVAAAAVELLADDAGLADVAGRMVQRLK